MQRSASLPCCSPLGDDDAIYNLWPAYLRWQKINSNDYRWIRFTESTYDWFVIDVKKAQKGNKSSAAFKKEAL